MRFYTKQHLHSCRIDLHARTTDVCILNQDSAMVFHRNMTTGSDVNIVTKISSSEECSALDNRGLHRGLDTNLKELPRPNAFQRGPQCRCQGKEFLETVRPHHKDHDCHPRGANVLLKLDVLIDGDETGEPVFHHECEELAVALAGPAQIDDMMNIVPRQLALERPGHTFIKQQPHWTRPSPALARGLRPPARASRSESR